MSNVSKSVRESRLWAWLKTNTAAQFKHHLHMCRIENAVMSGMPDVEGCYKGAQFWLELKCVARPANADTKIKARFQPQQIPWLKSRTKAGGSAFVLLQVGSGREARRYLIAGDAAGVLTSGVTEKRLASFSSCDPTASAAEIIAAAAIIA